MKVRTVVTEALSKFPNYRFTQKQIDAIVYEVETRELLEYYEGFFITDQELINMIINIAKNVINSVPNQAYYLKPPKSK